MRAVYAIRDYAADVARQADWWCYAQHVMHHAPHAWCTSARPELGTLPWAHGWRCEAGTADQLPHAALAAHATIVEACAAASEAPALPAALSKHLRTDAVPAVRAALRGSDELPRLLRACVRALKEGNVPRTGLNAGSIAQAWHDVRHDVVATAEPSSGVLAAGAGLAALATWGAEPAGFGPKHAAWRSTLAIAPPTTLLAWHPVAGLLTGWLCTAHQVAWPVALGAACSLAGLHIEDPAVLAAQALALQWHTGLMLDLTSPAPPPCTLHTPMQPYYVWTLDPAGAWVVACGVGADAPAGLQGGGTVVPLPHAPVGQHHFFASIARTRDLHMAQLQHCAQLWDAGTMLQAAVSLDGHTASTFSQPMPSPAPVVCMGRNVNEESWQSWATAERSLPEPAQHVAGIGSQPWLHAGLRLPAPGDARVNRGDVFAAAAAGACADAPALPGTPWMRDSCKVAYETVLHWWMAALEEGYGVVQDAPFVQNVPGMLRADLERVPVTHASPDFIRHAQGHCHAGAEPAQAAVRQSIAELLGSAAYLAAAASGAAWGRLGADLWLGLPEDVAVLHEQARGSDAATIAALQDKVQAALAAESSDGAAVVCPHAFTRSNAETEHMLHVVQADTSGGTPAVAALFHLPEHDGLHVWPAIGNSTALRRWDKTWEEVHILGQITAHNRVVYFVADTPPPPFSAVVAQRDFVTLQCAYVDPARGLYGQSMQPGLHSTVPARKPFIRGQCGRSVGFIVRDAQRNPAAKRIAHAVRAEAASHAVSGLFSGWRSGTSAQNAVAKDLAQPTSGVMVTLITEAQMNGDIPGWLISFVAKRTPNIWRTRLIEVLGKFATD